MVLWMQVTDRNLPDESDVVGHAVLDFPLRCVCYKFLLETRSHTTFYECTVEIF